MLPIITWQLIFIDSYPKYSFHKLFLIPNLFLCTNMLYRLCDTKKQWNLFASTFLSMTLISLTHLVVIKDKMYTCMNILLLISVCNGCMSGICLKEPFL